MYDIIVTHLVVPVACQDGSSSGLPEESMLSSAGRRLPRTPPEGQTHRGREEALLTWRVSKEELALMLSLSWPVGKMVDYFCLQVALDFFRPEVVCVLDYHLMRSLKAAGSKQEIYAATLQPKYALYVYILLCNHEVANLQSIVDSGGHLYVPSPQHEYDPWNCYYIHKMVSEASF